MMFLWLETDNGLLARELRGSSTSDTGLDMPEIKVKTVCKLVGVDTTTVFQNVIFARGWTTLITT